MTRTSIFRDRFSVEVSRRSVVLTGPEIDPQAGADRLSLFLGDWLISNLSNIKGRDFRSPWARIDMVEDGCAIHRLPTTVAGLRLGPSMIFHVVRTISVVLFRSLL